MATSLAPAVQSIQDCARETLVQAGVAPDQVTRLVMVGGSSLLGAVQISLRALCPNAKVESENAMTAVADGLALAASEKFS